MARVPVTQPPEYQPQPKEGPDMPTLELPNASVPESQPWANEQSSPSPSEIPASI